MYYSTCDYFMINEQDDRRKKLTAPRPDKKTPSQLFFEFIIGFIDKVEEQMKVKPKKKVAPKVQGVSMMAMLAGGKK